MNRYPLWKYLLILAVVLIGFIYALPNLYGEDPAVQVAPARSASVDKATLVQIEGALKKNGIAYKSASVDDNGAKVRFDDTETQIQAQDVIKRELGKDYVVAQNLLPAIPKWMEFIGASPMSLGLDLRGGVYFLMQVDMRPVLKKAEDSALEDARRLLRENKIRDTEITRGQGGTTLEVKFKNEDDRDRALELFNKELADLQYNDADRNGVYLISGRLKEDALLNKKKLALEQNINSLSKRVHMLGVTEPIIQQQGTDRIVVQLPGVQDSTEARRIIGRTATLEVMLVDEENQNAARTGDIPPGSKLFNYREGGGQILLKNRVIYSGDNITDAQQGFDSMNGGAIVNIALDSRGTQINKTVTADNVNKRMAVVYIEIVSDPALGENGKPMLDDAGRELRTSRRVEEVITAPVIRSPLGQRFQIEGVGSVEEAQDLALLLRAGAFAAPVEIIEERTVGPSLGKENIERGFKSTMYGFIAIAIFMIIYYSVFGVTAVLALAVNLLLLVGLLSFPFPELRTTLTLAGIAGIALTVGMAIDANVLINERIREELRNGNTPHAAIQAGYDRAFGTIFDSNITTLIAGLALLFVPGSVHGFAVVLCLGILTSMFSGVLVSRALVNLLFGRRPKIGKLPIGNTDWHAKKA